MKACNVHERTSPWGSVAADRMNSCDSARTTFEGLSTFVAAEPTSATRLGGQTSTLRLMNVMRCFFKTLLHSQFPIFFIRLWIYSKPATLIILPTIITYHSQWHLLVSATRLPPLSMMATSCSAVLVLTSRRAAEDYHHRSFEDQGKQVYRGPTRKSLRVI